MPVRILCHTRVLWHRSFQHHSCVEYCAILESISFSQWRQGNLWRHYRITPILLTIIEGGISFWALNMQLPRRQRCYSWTTMRVTLTTHTILLQPTLERCKQWCMGYYRHWLHAEEFKTHHGEHGRLHLEFHKHSDWPEQLWNRRQW